MCVRVRMCVYVYVYVCTSVEKHKSMSGPSMAHSVQKIIYVCFSVSLFFFLFLSVSVPPTSLSPTLPQSLSISLSRSLTHTNTRAHSRSCAMKSSLPVTELIELGPCAPTRHDSCPRRRQRGMTYTRFNTHSYRKCTHALSRFVTRCQEIRDRLCVLTYESACMHTHLLASIHA